MCMIVVQKRITQRMFAMKGAGLDNPPPGTVLDHSITRREWFDFFLVSQHVRQGTVTPTHYVVVYDDSGMKADHIQRLSFKLTHLYYNWPGTIRVPAPCQYAHKLAYLVGESLHKDPALELSDRLFFLWRTNERTNDWTDFYCFLHTCAMYWFLLVIICIYGQRGGAAMQCFLTTDGC